MSHGIQVWNASGGLTLDVTDRITRFVASFNVSVPAYGSYTDVAYSGVEPGSWAAYSGNGADILPKIENGFIRCYRRMSVGSGDSAVSATIYLFRY